MKQRRVKPTTQAVINPSQKPARADEGVRRGRAKPIGAKRRATGTDMQLFLGLRFDVEGDMDIGSPRWRPEYKTMRVGDVRRRIESDIAELVARAYPTYREDWAKKYLAPGWFENV